MSSNPIGKTLLDQYRVDAFIASGGMGVLYRVWDMKRNVPLAMKVLHADLAEDPSILKRFQREARALQMLTHPNIVPFYGIYQTENFAFLLEAYVDGPSLMDILRRRKGLPLPTQDILIYLKALSAALGYAHVHGVVHCDVKPGNVMIDKGGFIYLTDFGIARHAESTVTTLGAAGTPAYMAPEQIRGDAVSPATDVYSLGVLLFRMLTGQRPFRGDEKDTEGSGQTAAERTRYAHQHLPPPSLRGLNLSIPESLEQVVLKALVKDPRARYQSTLELYRVYCAAVGVLPETVPERLTFKEEEVTIFFTPSQPQPQTLAGSVPAGVTPSDEEKQPLVERLRDKMGFLIAGGGAVLIMVLLLLWSSWNNPSAIPLPTNQLAAEATVTNSPISTQIISTETRIQMLVPTPSPTLTSTSLPTLTHTSTPTKTPKPVGGGGMIAFQSDRTGNNEIYVMNADGSNVKQVTHRPADDRAPSWSLDGKEIGFQSNADGDFEIYVVTLSTNNIRQITSNSCNDYAPVWSPNGNKFVFYSDCDGNREIYTMNADGSGRRQLTHTHNIYNWFPTWSPDGREITFTSNVSGKYQIHVMNVDGSSLKALTNGCASWFSPDGNRILYGSYCTDPGEILIMKSDGSNARIIYGEYGNNNPSWSRDGNKIVFQSDQTGSFDIWMMDADGANLVQLTSHPSRDAVPVWQP